MPSITALEIVKARLNRLASDTSIDSYLNTRIAAAIKELADTGIHIDPVDARDIIFLADIVVWQYQNRDKPGAMPDWLRLARRERWLQQHRPVPAVDPVVEPPVDGGVG